MEFEVNWSVPDAEKYPEMVAACAATVANVSAEKRASDFSNGSPGAVVGGTLICRLLHKVLRKLHTRWLLFGQWSQAMGRGRGGWIGAFRKRTRGAAASNRRAISLTSLGLTARSARRVAETLTLRHLPS